MVLFMTPPTRFQTFFMDQAQCFAQSIVHRNGSGVMICPFVAPILFDHGDIEIPALHLRASRANSVKRALVEADGRQSRRSAETFLCARITDVDAVVID